MQGPKLSARCHSFLPPTPSHCSSCSNSLGLQAPPPSSDFCFLPLPLPQGIAGGAHMAQCSRGISGQGAKGRGSGPKSVIGRSNNQVGGRNELLISNLNPEFFLKLFFFFKKKRKLIEKTALPCGSKWVRCFHLNISQCEKSRWQTGREVRTR